MNRGRRWKTWAQRGWENLDALLVMVVAAVVVVLDIADPDLDPQVVRAATLALLGVMAFMLLRDREARGDLGELRQVARDALSDQPYRIVWQRNEWDLSDRHLATVSMTCGLRFTRNHESTLSHWSRGDGSITDCVASWRRPSGQWIKAVEIDKITARGGTKRVFSLGEEHARGDMLEWQVAREARDRFSSAHESVTHEAKAESDFPRTVRILWPPGEPPSHVEMRLGDRPAQTLSLKSEEGRTFIDETVGRLAEGEIFSISWNW